MTWLLSVVVCWTNVRWWHVSDIYCFVLLLLTCVVTYTILLLCVHIICVMHCRFFFTYINPLLYFVSLWFPVLVCGVLTYLDYVLFVSRYSCISGSVHLWWTPNLLCLYVASCDVWCELTCLCFSFPITICVFVSFYVCVSRLVKLPFARCLPRSMRLSASLYMFTGHIDAASVALDSCMIRCRISRTRKSTGIRC